MHNNYITRKLSVNLTLSFLLLSNIFFTKITIAVENANDVQNATAAHHSQRKTFIDKQITSEFHRYKQAKKKATTKYLKKKMSDTSWQQHKKIMKIFVTGNKNIKTANIKAIIKPYLRKGVTEKETKLISDDIENYYRKQGYFLPVAHVEIIDSTLKITIIEGKINTVVIGFADPKRDKKVLKNKRFLDLIQKIEIASPLKTKYLEKNLLLINKIHGYTVNYELRPVEQLEGNNVADLIIEISTKKGTASISANNHGTSDLGKHQLTVSAQAFNVTSNDSLLLTAGTSDKPKKFQLITGGYLKRLNSYGTSASIFLSHLKDDPQTTSDSKDNISNIIKGRLDQYVVLNNAHQLKLELSAEQRDVEHYSGSVKTSEYKYAMGSFGGKIKLTDPLEVENWFFPYFHQVLNKVSYEKDSTEKRNFDRDFNYFTIDYNRTQPLPKDFALFVQASYQYTNKLLPSEHRYSINSSNTARGYIAGLVSADQGISGKLELRYTRKISKNKIKKFLEDAQIFAFYDVTHFIKHNKTIDRKEHQDAMYFNKSTLSGVGVGFRLFFQNEFFAEGTAEFPTVKNIMINGSKEKNNPLYRFSITKEFNW